MDGIMDSMDVGLGGLRELVMDREVPGSSPGGSRVIQRGDGVGQEKTYLFINLRLGRNSVVGKFSREKRLNNLVYVEN